jgi:hypothetical protein
MSVLKEIEVRKPCLATTLGFLHELCLYAIKHSIQSLPTRFSSCPLFSQREDAMGNSTGSSAIFLVCIRLESE